MSPNARGTIVIVSGPTGVGKTTVCERLLALPGYARSISVTTRLPRKGEVPDRDYAFFTREAFVRARDEGLFLEWARVHDDFYGTPRGPVEANLDDGKNVILNIDVQGAAQVRRSGLPCRSFFILPPSLDELRLRLARRGDDPAVVERRLKNAEIELSHAGEYDHRIVNDVVERTVDEIVLALARMRESAKS
jgi:guanylate kinase